MNRVVPTLVLVLATVGCGEVARDPQRCDGPWCPIASGQEQRVYHAAVWTGEELLVWGGLDDNDGEPLATGLRINPETGAVRSISTQGAPSPRWAPFAVWTGHEMLIWGGQFEGSEGTHPTPASTAGGGAYDPKSDAWRPIIDPRPEELVGSAVAWTGSERRRFQSTTPDIALSARVVLVLSPLSLDEFTRYFGRIPVEIVGEGALLFERKT